MNIAKMEEIQTEKAKVFGEIRDTLDLAWKLNDICKNCDNEILRYNAMDGLDRAMGTIRLLANSMQTLNRLEDLYSQE